MINSNVFDYINVLNKAADAAWTRNEVLANNIANNDTPYYKRKDVSFEESLQRAIGSSRYGSLDAKVSEVSLKKLNARIYTDAEGYSYRLDKNNVDIDTENVELAANQIKYNGLVDSMIHEYTRIKAVIK